MSVYYDAKQLFKLHKSKQSLVLDLSNYTRENKTTLIGYLSTTVTTNRIDNNINYKLSYYYPIYAFIVDILIDIKFEYNDMEVILNKLTILNQGQKLLQKLHINKTTINIEEYLILASTFGTMMTFNFWLLQLNKDIIEVPSIKTLLLKSFTNSDDRIYKYLCKKLFTKNNIFINDKIFISTIVETLCSSTTIPIKYILRRLKVLSSYVLLIEFSSLMLKHHHNNKYFFDIHKYYYKYPYNFNQLMYAYEILLTLNLDIESQIDVIEYFQTILLTENEKIMLKILISFNMLDIDHMIQYDKLDSIVSSYPYECVELIMNNYKNRKNITMYEPLLKYVIKYNLITNYIESNINGMGSIIDKQLIYYTRYLCIEPNTINFKKLLTINYILYKFRMLVRRRYKKLINERDIKLYPLLHEIKTFTPRKNIAILKHGSINYQLDKQKFTNLPPRILLPGELPIYKNFLLREKVDGILVNNLPINIFPLANILHQYQIKAEYLEDLDLYLVFDIDIPNTSIIERYNILRNLHPLTKNKMQLNCNNMDDYNITMLNEHVIISNFLKDNTTKLIKWFPKFACLYNMNDMNNIYNDIISIILETNINYNYKLYNNDGLILSPLDGSREIKIKPISLMSIDLLYNGNKWLDGNMIDWSHLIQNIPKSCGIYRCYPKMPLCGSMQYFKIGDKRYDKKHPNPNIIVNCICKMLKHNWLKEKTCITSTIYYDTFHKLKNSKITRLLEKQKNLLIKKISELNPSLNKKWLDLGCGNGKLVSIINKYNPKTYLGLDIDICQLVKCLKYHDNNNIYNFTPCNLSDCWSDYDIKWYDIDMKIKYDYIVANFSLMHFFTDIFWQQLDIIVCRGTKFLFNLVNSDMIEWKQDNSYMKVHNNMTLYRFEWVHDVDKIEPLITVEKLNEMLLKYNWKINSKYSDNSELLNLYNWWIIEKN